MKSNKTQFITVVMVEVLGLFPVDLAAAGWARKASLDLRWDWVTFQTVLIAQAGLQAYRSEVRPRRRS